MGAMTDEQTLFSALVALARADGPISDQERAWLREVLERAGLGEEEMEGAGSLDREALRRAAPDAESRRTLLRFMLMVSLADGETSAPELGVLREVARDLDVSEAELEEMRRDTVLATEPEDL